MKNLLILNEPIPNPRLSLLNVTHAPYGSFDFMHELSATLLVAYADSD